MTAVALPRAHSRLGPLVAGVAVVVAVAAATFPRMIPARVSVSPTQESIAFVVALRTFETTSVSLADQAGVQSANPALRAASVQLRLDGNTVAARLWALLDRWGVPGTARLPAVTTGLTKPGPAAGLHHACLVSNDELGRMSLLQGRAFDQEFVNAWVGHTQAALQALAEAHALPGLGGVLGAATRQLQRDTGILAAA